MATSDALLDRMGQLHPKLIDLTLDRVERLLAALDHPEKNIGPVIHIAGTNGKGSTTAFMGAIARAMGRAANAYTSPHLVKFHERIALDGTPIDEAQLTHILDKCLEANGPEPITYFEITTVAAFLAFAENRADMCLLEVGLGGRFDATNVVDTPAACVITPVSLDHQHFLGDTLAKIAGEKAGIIKPGVPCIVGPQDEAAMDVIEAEAAKLGVPLTIYGQDYMAYEERGQMVLQHDAGLMELPLPALVGPHQIQNAATAIMALRAAGFMASEEELATGLRTATWPARLQNLSDHPLAARLPAGSSLTLDGGHNVAAGEMLGNWLSAQSNDPRPLWILGGMMETKDNVGFLRHLQPHAAGFIALPVASGATGAGLGAETMAEKALAAGFQNVKAASGVEAAFDMLPKGQPIRVLICGSLYLAGEVLALQNS